MSQSMVVSYRNSTSNHNILSMLAIAYLLYLIEILHQTTTAVGDSIRSIRLYLIEILHQTTTSGSSVPSAISLYLIEILHQTTTVQAFPMNAPLLYLIEILHQTTTYGRQRVPQKCCILSKFYIKPQQISGYVDAEISCILSKFYIKPQLWTKQQLTNKVVSYRNSTSNHN